MTENFEGNIGELGDYEILGKIAQGGMGIVYCARQKSRNRPVAIKMIRSGQLATAEERERFRIEAKAAAHLDHPNIVPIYEVGELHGQPFFSMKLIEGGSLREHIEDWGAADQKTQRHRAALVAKIARAVHHAHTRGVLHRDIKPTNILLDKEGEPYLGDFGLARIVEKDRDFSSEGIAGTATYMAPEQAFGPSSKLTTGADIYSLGAIFYHLLVGRAPFVGSREEVFRQLKSAPPEPVTLRNKQIDKNLEIICHKCLAKDPQGRYRSAEELAEDIERWFRSQPIWARPNNPKQIFTRWARQNPRAAIASIAAAALLVAGLTTIYTRLVRAESIVDENRASLVQLNVANGYRLWDEGDAFGAAVWFMEALRHDRGHDELYHRIRLATLFTNTPTLTRMIFPGGPVHTAQFSPDGTLILTASGTNAITLFDRTGIVTNFVHNGGDKPHAYFSADGQKIFSHNVSTIRLSSIKGEPISSITQSNLAHAILSTDTKLIATADSAGAIQFWHAETAGKIGGIAAESSISTLAFAPMDNRLLVAFRNGAISIHNPEPGKTAISWRARGDLRHAAFNKDGTRIITAHSNGESRIWDAATGAPTTPTMKENSWVAHAMFSPNENFVALSTGSDSVKLRAIANGHELAKLPGHKNAVLASVFNLDGSKIASLGIDGSCRVFDTSNASPITPLLWHGAVVTAAAFDLNSQYLLTSSADGAVRVWSLAKNPPSKYAPIADSRPFDQLYAYVQSLSSHYIDRNGSFAPIQGKKLEAAWKIATRAPK